MYDNEHNFEFLDCIFWFKTWLLRFLISIKIHNLFGLLFENISKVSIKEKFSKNNEPKTKLTRSKTEIVILLWNIKSITRILIIKFKKIKICYLAESFQTELNKKV